MTVVQHTPEDVGRYYDAMGHFYQTLWGDSIHFGYWPDPTDTTVSMSQAQINFTDLMIAHMGLAPGQRALDVGCGTGRPAIQLARSANVAVTAISVSESQIATGTEHARESGLALRAQAQGASGDAPAQSTPSVQFELVDAMAMPFEDASFDAAWAFESIFHMPSRVNVFREMARVVRPGGRVVVADFVTLHPLTPEEIAVVYPAFAANDLGSLEDYIGDLKQAGLMHVTCRDVTVNTIRPTNHATLAALQTEEARAKLASVYGAEQAESFLTGWTAIKQINETLAYVVLEAQRP